MIIKKNLKRRMLSLGILGCLFFTCTAQSIIEVQDMKISMAEQSYGSALKNKSVIGEKISIANIGYDKGIGVHANSTLNIRLNKSGRFTAKVGVSDNLIDYSDKDVKSVPLSDGRRTFYREKKGKKQFVGIEGSNGKIDKGSVIFKLIHNGAVVYNSGIMVQRDPVKEIDIKLGYGVLQLIVEDAGDGVSGDHAVWINPKIEYKGATPVAVGADYQDEKTIFTSEVDDALIKKLHALPEIEMPLSKTCYDWLINNDKPKAEVYKTKNGKDLVISNGLIARVFRLSPNLATIDYVNQMTGESILRAVSNEGTVTIDNKEYSLGGLSKQREYGYTLYEWIDNLKAAPNSFLIKDFKINDITDRLKWKRVRWTGNDKMPTGKEIVFTLEKDEIEVKVHFALYDGIPTLSKWIEIINNGQKNIKLNHFRTEQLALIEGENFVGNAKEWAKPNIHIESDYAYSGMYQKTSDRTTFWEKDKRYTTQTSYGLHAPCLLEVKLPIGPETVIAPEKSLTSFRVWEMPLDSYEKERKGLFIRKFYRTVSPWTTENPIFLHLISSDKEAVKKAVDQCAEVGYEMIILSFGSGMNMENESKQNYAKFKELREYANSKGIELGGYSLLSSRWISEEVDVINPKTGKRGGMAFGSAPCLCSEWGYNYFRKIKKFYNETGMQVFENDGSYPGDVCASIKHAHHDGLGDSQWKQFAQIQGLYKWMRSEGIYMNIPDFYLNSGANKVGIGYREVNWSLPRKRQLMHGRLNIYDGLWYRIPSMCWTFVPLTQYHGGGAAATLEPLKDHLKEYESHMMQNYGSGVQACYRGPRLYDAPETKKVVKNVITWYKKYREILNSDFIHLKRPSGKDWDGIMHVNPNLNEKGLLMVYNPTNEDMVRTINLPLYYTGLDKSVRIREKEGKSKNYKLGRDFSVSIEVKIEANSYNWLVIE